MTVNNQSTDRTSDNTDPKTPRVIARGEGEITMSTVSAGYAGAEQINISVETDLTMVDADVWVYYYLGPGSTYFYKLGFNQINSSTGATTRSGYIDVQQGTKPLSYVLEINLFDTNSVVQTVPPRYFYLIYSTVITNTTFI